MLFSENHQRSSRDKSRLCVCPAKAQYNQSSKWIYFRLFSDKRRSAWTFCKNEVKKVSQKAFMLNVWRSKNSSKMKTICSTIWITLPKVKTFESALNWSPISVCCFSKKDWDCLVLGLGDNTKVDPESQEANFARWKVAARRNLNSCFVWSSTWKVWRCFSFSFLKLFFLSQVHQSCRHSQDLVSSKLFLKQHNERGF